MPCQQRGLERDTTSYGPRSCFLPARVHVVMRIGGDVRAALSVVAARAVPGLVAEHGGGDGGSGRVLRLGYVFGNLVSSLVLVLLSLSCGLLVRNVVALV